MPKSFNFQNSKKPAPAAGKGAKPGKGAPPAFMKGSKNGKKC